MRFQDGMPITRIRQVTLEADGGLTINDDDVQAFVGRVYPPSETKKGPSDDASPRSYTPEQPMWYRPGRLPSPVRAGDRFVASGVTYEAVDPEYGKRAGLQVLVNEVILKPITGLYPVLAALQDLGGDDVAEIPAAYWTSNKTVANHGYYEEMAGEAPAEFFNELNVANRQLVIGGRTFRLSRVQLMTAQPHVRFSLKGAA